jgi:hypothetical protein
MAVDVSIGTVETQLTAQDPELVRNAAFIAKIVAAVKEELAREELVKARRDADRTASRGVRNRS